jgi:hypothetical protein|tara:strand:- start:3190 stop:3333 length:144 start_codon:yes stop_codon:yes gene_type:complete
MPKRNEQSYMIVKTQWGDVKVDKDGNRSPLVEEKEIKKQRKAPNKRG